MEVLNISLSENSNSEVKNNTPSVLIIGYGIVGQFMHKYFTGADVVDLDGRVRTADNEPVPDDKTWEYGLVCVPTPPLPSGRCDTSLVESAIEQWSERVRLFCIKSTLEIGTTDAINAKLGAARVCMSPEHTGETLGHAFAEPTPDTFIILGGPHNVTREWAEVFTLVTNSCSRISQTDAKTAELCKLMENSFIAAKVTFVNEFFDLAEAVGVDFNELRELWLADHRISRHHTYCYRNNRGFDGKCLPKDLKNLAWYYRNNAGETRARLIEFLLEYNEDLRSRD